MRFKVGGPAGDPLSPDPGQPVGTVYALYLLRTSCLWQRHGNAAGSTCCRRPAARHRTLPGPHW